MSSKLPHLQGIRGLAILAVVLFHFIPFDIPNGFLGVDMFFVLSGYLMPYILSRNEQFGPRELGMFWYRRIKRIFPLYYLVVLLITSSLFFLPIPSLPNILDSMFSALQFTTNFQPVAGLDYFFILSAFIDPFTHTWSLCVEIQFYLLFPLLYFVYQHMPENYKACNVVWIVIGSASLSFYFLSPENIAFNCVLARLWQFTAGIITFYLTEQTPQKKAKDRWSPSWTALGIASLTLFTPFKIAKDYTRLLITCVTPLLISHGAGNDFLENQITVFLGEVSYAWYLIHWPIVCYIRSFELYQIYYYPLFIALSIVLATVIQYAYERWYLQWGYFPIFIVILFLSLATVVLSTPLGGLTALQMKQARLLAKNYSHLTKEEVIQFNIALQNLDIPLLTPENCTFSVKPVFNWQGFCEYEEPYPRRGNNTLMIIGNSWAANVLYLVHEECEPFVRNMSAYTIGACDVLPDPSSSCKTVPKFVEYVERIKPDVLFIISRAIGLKHVDDGMLPLEDSVFASSLRRLELLQPLVKKKIFILNAFPNIHPKITSNVNNFLRYGSPHPNISTIDLPVGVKVARMRTEELVRRCEKCELFDYVPSFSVRRELTLYDPKTFVTFANSVLHLTLAGQEKVRPLYREICHRLPQL